MKSSLLGSWTFADAARLERGLDALFETDPDDWYPDIDDIACKGLEISIYYDDYEDRPYYPAPRRKVEALAAFVGDAAAAPRPRHYRYEAYFAARDNDIARLRELVALGADINGPIGWRHKTCIHEAAKWDTSDMIDVLIASGADVHVATRSGWLPIQSPCRAPVVRSLLAAGADPAVALASAMTKPLEVVELLLAAGAVPRPDQFRELAETGTVLSRIAVLRDLVARAPDFRAALTTPAVVRKAIASRDPVTLDFILEQGAILPDDFLAESIRSGGVELVDAALRAPEAMALCGASNRSEDAMCRAAVLGHTEIMQLLADRGVPIHPTLPGATTPLREAASGNHTKALAWLLEHGAPYDEDAAHRITTPDGAMFFIERGWDPGEAFHCDLTESEEDDLRARIAAWRQRTTAR